MEQASKLTAVPEEDNLSSGSKMSTFAKKWETGLPCDVDIGKKITIPVTIAIGRTVHYFEPISIVYNTDASVPSIYETKLPTRNA